MSAIDGKIMATRSDCYQTGQKMTPEGIIVHSTGCNNPNIKRYVAPGNDDIGYNNNGNSMNEPGQDVCVHMIIGKNASGKVKCYQILPFDICCWGVGSGWKGSYNYNPAYIQFEMCEDGLDDYSYCKACYDKAVAVCAELAKKYGFSVDCIKSHHEAGQEGMGSQHVDPDNWWKYHGFTMSGFRSDVKKAINGGSSSSGSSSSSSSEMYRIRKSWNDPKSQIGAYSSLENAKKAWKKGYTIYDNNGKAVYPTSSSSSNSSSKTPSITYAVYNGSWLPAVKNTEDYAGVNGTRMQGLVAKSSVGTLEYRVHTVGGNWLPWVSKYDTSDWNNGIAGFKGANIDGVQMRLKGASGYEVKYRVSTFDSNGYYDWVVGTEDYAGSYGKTIDCVQAYAVKK